MDYIITGLPRTRLAWLANYFTYGDSFCAFDATRNGLDNIDEFFPTWKHQDRIEGIADHGAMMIQDQLIEKFPEAKWAIIERDYSEVVESIKNLEVKPDSTQLHDMYVKLGELKLKKVGLLVIPYNQINDSLVAISRFIAPNLNIPAARTEMLKELNVQMDKEKGLSQKHAMVGEPVKLTIANEEYTNLLWEMCQPNQSAYTFLMQVIGTALTWDHLIDDDPVDKRLLDQVFKALLTEWPINPFINQFGSSLAPMLSSCISDWQYSYMNGASKESAYSIYADLPAAVAFILGGQKKVDLFMPRIRKLVAMLCYEDNVRDSNKK